MVHIRILQTRHCHLNICPSATTSSVLWRREYQTIVSVDSKWELASRWRPL